MAALFTPFTLRSVTLPNRIMISPMCQYSAHEGFANEWHTAYITKVSQGRPGCVMVEVSVVEKRGRGTYGDLGIWEDGHIAGMRALATIIESYGAVPAIQIGHACFEAMRLGILLEQVPLPPWPRRVVVAGPGQGCGG